MSEYIRAIKALGEVVLRVRDTNTMQEFYEKVVGLELLGRNENIMTFFRIAPDYEGHTQRRHCSTRLTVDRPAILG